FLTSLAFADASHKHFLATSNDTTEQFQSHDCGEQEHHKPLDVRFHCVQSCRVLAYSYTHSFGLVSPDAAIQYVRLSYTHTSCVSGISFSESKRGPPTFMS
ncbi:MAG TPA: hypothetical protein VII11_02470, partial [Bacteroidota bacterium]